MHTSIPKTAVKSDHIRTTLTKCLIATSSPISNSSDMCFTAEKEIPKLVACETKLTVALKSETNPMPLGPSKTAASLLRTRLTNMLSP